MKCCFNKWLRSFLVLVTVVLVLFCTYDWWTLPSVVPATEISHFSAERAAKDLEVIAQEPHSVEHPQARSKVRDYLANRLEEMGGTVTIYPFDSIAFRFGGTYSIGNVYAEFAPQESDPQAYVLFIAHMDSRFRQQVLDKTVYSYGAADDGYGLAVTLELVRDALLYQADWKQGIKVLFTDSEENDLDGIRKMLEVHPSFLDRVGLIVNLEARGVKGPVLLFETSDANARVMDLYAQTAQKPVTYSLTSVVYRMMPNFTDFTELKADYPGVNFSCLEDINYYHTDQDCFDNINLETIQHYGTQLEPLLERYMTDVAYADPSALCGEQDAVFFTLPGLGLIKLTPAQNSCLTLVTLLLAILAISLSLKLRVVRAKQLLLKSLWILLWGVGILVAGEGLVWLLARLVGTPFSLTATKFIPMDQGWFLGSVALLLAAIVGTYLRRGAKREWFANETLCASLIVLSVLGGGMTLAFGENFFFLFPVLVTSVAWVFYLFFDLMLVNWVALLLNILLAASFLYNLFIALTIGAMGVILFLVFLNALVMVALFVKIIRLKA